MWPVRFCQSALDRKQRSQVIRVASEWDGGMNPIRLGKIKIATEDTSPALFFSRTDTVTSDSHLYQAARTVCAAKEQLQLLMGNTRRIPLYESTHSLRVGVGGLPSV